MGVEFCMDKPKASPESRLSAQALPSASRPGRLEYECNGSQNMDKGEFAPYYTTERKD
jgi:hypothetical protein